MKTFSFEWNRRRAWLALFGIVVVALLLRTSGLFRGLDAGYMFHPDEPKQVMALKNYLEGRYVWYVGSLFYDGYPVGLNHVDEWLLRPVLAGYRLWKRHLQPSLVSDPVPDQLTLFYWARSLRVLYGLGGVVLAYVLARRLWGSHGPALAAAALVAVAPLPVVVTHSATGDIGPDLFTAFVLLFLCRYAAGSRRVWLGAAGLATGLAFACKYNGALAGLAVALFLLLEWWHDRHLAGALRSGFTVGAGFLIGVVLGTPAFLIDRARTWKYMYANFEFLRNYDASDEFLARPAWDKVVYCLTKNTGPILSALGWTLTLLAVASLVLVAFRFRKIWTEQDSGAPDRQHAILMPALLVFPFAALFVALSGKPEVQPFHFSWLQLPLTVAAVYALRRLWRWRGRWGQVAAAILFTVTVLEFGRSSEQDLFFWTRGDNLRWKGMWPSLLARTGDTPAGAPDTVKWVYLEPSGRTVFRNRASTVVIHNADFWNRLHVAPVPGVPGPVDQDWIFPNGPVFPRDDRLFQVERDDTAARQVVFYNVPGEVTLGFRSGSWPAAVTVEFGGETRTLVMAPNAQQTLRLAPRRWRHNGGNRLFPQGSYIVPLTVRTQTGPAWVTVMTDERETHLFQLFGGKIIDRARLQPSDVPSLELINEMQRMRYLEGESMRDLVADEPLDRVCRVPADGVALPCGPYILRCEIRGLTDEAEVTVKLDDFYRSGDLAAFEETFRLQAGVQVVTSRFAKIFAPYHGQIEMVCKKGNVRLERWSLVPDTRRIRDDFQRWADGGTAPVWLGGGAAEARVQSNPVIRFGNRASLIRLDFPGTIPRTGKIPVFCIMEMERLDKPDFGEYSVFIHLLDRDGKMVDAVQFPLWQAVAVGALNKPIMCDVPENLPPGDYALAMGVYNSRTEHRLPIQGNGLSEREQRKRFHLFGKTTVTE
jgi:hypothetical protein